MNGLVARRSLAAWAGLLGLLEAAPARAMPPVSMSAGFTLRVTAGSAAQTSTGVVRFFPQGSVCILVESPLRQELLLARDRLLVYYPGRDLALRERIPSGSAPPMLDAIVAGVIDPTSALPSTARLAEQRRVGGKLATRWHLADAKGTGFGELRIVETREGTESLEMRDEAGQLQRTFAFADRVRLGGRSVPRSIIARYHGRGGSLVREEVWTLNDVAPLGVGSPGEETCARQGPATKIQDL